VIINSCRVASRKHFFKKDNDSLSVISKLLCKVLIDHVRTVKKQSLYFWNLPRSKKMNEIYMVQTP
jgi:hypothetical protein